MNRLTSRQRKLVYAAGLAVLLIPIFLLGMPATGSVSSSGEVDESGGRLAQLRREYDLGETNLGDVDPTSATMNLVLLGMRGIATNLLWMEHEELKKTKNWAQMRATTESIIMLQPHYLQVWRYHGWDLAYNVSAEWDAVEDRYYWVKEGTKFIMKGSDRNKRYPELYWDTGRFLGQKIGRADESAFFRDYFKSDPFREDGQADPEINPESKDNYLAAKDWFYKANAAEDLHEQHIMMRILFRSYPYRSQFDYAQALQKEGYFDEVARIAWEDAYKEWTQEFGKQQFEAPECPIILEATEDDFQSLARQADVDEKVVRHWVNNYQKVTNYRYWRTRAQSESEPETVAAHRELHQGEEFFKRGELEKARELLESGMRKFRLLIDRHPDLATQDETIEEGLWAVMLWQKILQLEQKEVPAFYPLQPLWERHQDWLPILQIDFDREYGGL